VAFIQICVLSDLKLAYANCCEQSSHGARAGRSFMAAKEPLGEIVDLPWLAVHQSCRIRGS
jgi:hypothetical protein